MKSMFKKIVIFLFCAILLCSTTSVQAKISSHVADHIKQRHWYCSKENTSKFNPTMTIHKLDQMAQKTILNGSVRCSKQGQGCLTHQYHFQHQVGLATNGKKAYSLRVVTDGRGNVITAFPTK
jgi:hypothetical protein